MMREIEGRLCRPYGSAVFPIVSNQPKTAAKNAGKLLYKSHQSGILRNARAIATARSG